MWLWLTTLFATLAESVAEGRGKAQAKSLRATRSTTMARVADYDAATDPAASAPSSRTSPSADLNSATSWSCPRAS